MNERGTHFRQQMVQYGFWCPNLPRTDWEAFKALRAAHDLSTRQAIIVMLEAWRYVESQPELAARFKASVLPKVKLLE